MTQFVRSKYRYKFNPDKAYLMIGCLGGLGRSISKWMMTQGAHRLIFMSRSGADSASAKKAVESFNNAGGDVTVLKGDVSSESDMRNAISQIKEPIGGVVSSAMALDVSSSFREETYRVLTSPRNVFLHQCLQRAGKPASTRKYGDLGTYTTPCANGNQSSTSSS